MDVIDYDLPTLLGRYLNALEEAARLEMAGLADEAKKQRDVAALICAAVEHGWPLEEILSACKHEMDSIIVDGRSAQDHARYS